MADHVIVEREGSGNAVMIGIIGVVVIGIVVLFFIFGGPGRFAPAQTAAPNNTNVNVPAQGQQPPAAAPNINIPRQIDVNVNQPAQQAPAAPAAPAQQAPAGGGGR